MPNAKAQRIGVYPGTFDPITNGHVDIISRATRVVDKLVVAVAVNGGKEPLFTLDERVAMVEADLANIQTPPGTVIEVRPFDNLLVEFVADVGAGVIVRGLRAVSDFEYEFQMAAMNARLSPKLETVFLMASDRNQFISSRFVKEIGRLGGDIRHFVSAAVAQHVRARYELDA
ncbi:MAG: pantetheine-phosphate adenylyltransferase [Alphaproteobacteria bacterium]|nr:pantetheine-phosphate adenylyltransferase [Alphaproteobacteria bacterium]MBF0249639.1 pantetheine-phosphate adenylyltransferase [Alphaproteobacteria bacterium]